MEDEPSDQSVHAVFPNLTSALTWAGARPTE